MYKNGAVLRGKNRIKKMKSGCERRKCKKDRRRSQERSSKEMEKKKQLT
jgi:hypothetical protein